MRNIFLVVAVALLMGSRALVFAQTTRATTEVQRTETQSVQRSESSARPQTTAQGAAQTAAQPPASTAVKAAVSQRNYADAVRLSETAAAAAVQAGNRQAAADHQMDRGRIIQQWVAEDINERGRLNDAAVAYREVIQQGNPVQQTLARNYLGEVLLQQGKAGEAVQAFRAMDLSTIDASKRYVLEYNFGRALEVSGDPRAAYEKYSAVVLERPTFKLAAERSFDILKQTTPARVDEVVRLSTVLLKNGEIESASSRLKDFLKSWGGQPNARVMLTPLVQYYTIQAYSPRQFLQTEAQFLADLQRAVPALGRPIAEIRRVYEGPLNPFVSPQEARSVFPSWTETAAQRDAFSALLVSVGKQFNRDSAPREALARLSAAWMVQPDRTDGAVELAATLRANRNLRDANGRLFDQLVNGLFEAKGQAYAAQDWPNILRLHVVLANIFEEDRNWGADNNPRGAMFQWEHAIEAERRVRASDPTFPPSPGLHMHLANCYKVIGRPAQALTEYINAGEAFVRAGDKAGAAAAIQELRGLNVAVRPELQNRVQTIQNFATSRGQ